MAQDNNNNQFSSPSLSRTSSPAVNPHGGGYIPQIQHSIMPAAPDDSHGGGYIPRLASNRKPVTESKAPSSPPPVHQPIPAQNVAYSRPPPPPQVQPFNPTHFQPQTNYTTTPQEVDAQESEKRSGLGKQAVQTVRELRFGERGGIADTVSGTEDGSIRRTWQRGYYNITHRHNAIKLPKFPNLYQKPGLLFHSLEENRHRDCMQREYKGPQEDKYLSPTDGHLAKLVVQAAQDVYDGPLNSTWRRTFVRNVSASYMQAANFPFHQVPTDRTAWTNGDWMSIVIRWLPSCAGLFCVLLMNPSGTGIVKNNGYYDAFTYKHWSYPMAAKNPREAAPNHLKINKKPEAEDAYDNYRIHGPRVLCFLINPESKSAHGALPREVLESEQGTDYIFIGYTAEQFNHGSEDDMEALHVIADQAARTAGVSAYWVACSCMPGDEEETVQDVFRIADVMRGAHSFVIAVGASSSRPHVIETDQMLRVWGERMWTLPEVLLSSPQHNIEIFVRGEKGPAKSVAKKNLATLIWEDPRVSRQLVDHYNGNLTLSRLELVTIALECLTTRRTTEKFRGDRSYALMGLLRRRPRIVQTDTPFQAFARLSLANDSDMLLERLICTLPKNHRADWSAMDDAWECKLWDIVPRCQVAGIGPGDTVLLDGAFAAHIRWKSFAPVAYVANTSWKRIFAQIFVHGAPIYFLVAISLIGASKSAPSLYSTGAFILVCSLLVLLASPYLIRIMYGGKLWGTQAWFFGFEGYMDLATIESQIFGAYQGRLSWSSAGSSISEHRENELGECVGIDPTTNPRVVDMLERAKSGVHGDLKVFTLVDTYSMTVTMFTAVRPPVAVVLCGHEGGMQRAVMCSYDWRSQTLFRESVLRLPTPVLEKMFRINRFRFGLQRPMEDIQ